MKTMPVPPTLRVLLLAGVCLTLIGGCEMLGFLAALGGEKVPAEHKLDDRRTLVMVEDPDRHLGRTSLAGLMAESIGRKLQESKTLSEEGRLIPQDALRELQQRLGEDYRQTPIVQIGRLVDAEQVIHVRVRGVDLARAPGVYEPRMRVEVKLLDAVASERLYPRAMQMQEQWDNQGRVLTAELSVRTPETMDSGTRARIMRELAQHTGVRIAQLFFKHKKPEPGATLR